ncbi:PREDICTED: thrombomodulin [Lepidothrix coronata]|uniref:Thrombomodulin n=1 Tax=Lepidothrix coronata TaxID=321398 RepID=A0A6J0J228_9PASS|nr:PREDICTED: thrombomodulin [Lepidothrix coronata]
MRRLPLLLPLLLLLGMGLGAPGEPGEPEPLAPSGAQCLQHACFAVFWGSRPFAAASAGCERGGGHLMTVRSTVAEEAIALLLQNRGGRLWLGLSLAPSLRCTEPARRLRGFRWVTEDNRTDYTNWAPSGPRCGERCVTVSRELRWEERRCEDPADGFLCEYNYGSSCPLLPSAEGLPVSYTTPFGARGGEFLALPPRSVASVPALGLELRCDEDGEGGRLRWGRAEPGAWPCRLGGGGCEGACSEGAGGPRCSCPDGAVLGPDGRGCRSPCAGAPCQQHCVVSGSSFVCMCDTGYHLGADGSSCEDNDDCASEPGLCEQLCVNTMGGFECRCYAGYRMVDGHCQRESHCYRAPCEQSCEDVPGGYRCGCYDGYAVDPRDPARCRLHCSDSQCPPHCSQYSEGCECPEGFLLDDDKLCVDIDECDMNYCEHNCTNHPGGYRCHCPAGYRLVNDLDCAPLPEQDAEGPPFSGDFESQTLPPPTAVPRTPPPSRTPPKAEPLHPGALVGIAVGAVLTALAPLALGYYLAKKRCRPPATMDYKCGGPHEKELGLQPVASGCAGPAQKL